MTFYHNWMANKDERTERERELEWELEDARRREEERREEELRQFEQRRQERQERWDFEMRQATTWPEALGKQASLMGGEAHLDQWGDDNYFGDGRDSCKRALELWHEVEAEKRAEIEALEAKIKAIRDGIRFEVADRLEEEGDPESSGWMGTVSILRDYDEDPAKLSRWLDW